jgi:thioredoxin reductase (NADPH)
MTQRAVDIAVIGAGPCGLAVAAAAVERGLHSVVFDRGPLCASLLGYPPYMSFFSTSEKLEIQELPFTTERANPTRREALTYYRGVAKFFGIHLKQYHEVTAISPRPKGFTLETRRADGEREDYSAKAVVVATGAFGEPNQLGVRDQDVLVVGGGNSSVEAALELFRVGARVTMVHFAGEFDSGVKAWILPDILNRIEHREIAVRWRHRVVEIHPRSVILKSVNSGGIDELPNDWVLALTGWRPDSMLLQAVGVPVDQESGIPMHDPETMETPIPGLFVAGVLAAGFDANRIFIENGRHHGRQIVHRILGVAE